MQNDLRRYFAWDTNLAMQSTVEKSALARFREGEGLTLEGLKKRLHPQVTLSQSQLSRIERSGTTSLDTALNLSRATGIPVEAFVRGA